MVAMSGGVDSSVALLRILEMGYEPIGVTMKLWEYTSVGGNTLSDTNCCSVESINGAKLVCDRLGVPHYTVDFTGIFRDQVIDDFAEEYLKGRTPNPCVRCNSFVKWEAFFHQAQKIGAKYIATGHYARIEKINNQPHLLKGLDPKKDQGYVLWGIPRETLAKTFLPLGDLTKKEVRQIASDNGLETAQTPESMEICFIADNNYKRFLGEYRHDDVSAVGSGNLIENGIVIGEHPGYINYTIGQRKGLGLSRPEPRYVNRIDPDTNSVHVGRKESLYSSSCYVSSINWLIDQPDLPLQVSTQIRYNSTESFAFLTEEGNRFKVVFEEPRLSITPGQSIVFYKDDIVLGGGVIELD